MTKQMEEGQNSGKELEISHRATSSSPEKPTQVAVEPSEAFENAASGAFS